MKALYLDAFSGISGDMVLGLFADLGIDREALQSELAKLALPDWEIDWRREQRMGIHGTRAEVRCQPQAEQRRWHEIDDLLANSPLSAKTIDRARTIFRTLGEAEAHIHDQPLDEVHFHEVGALDAIIDITAAALGLEMLGIDRLVCTPLPVNHGFVATAHGRLPLPAPAVARLLEGSPIQATTGDQELVTPTGAAIVVACGTFDALPSMALERVGYGVGGRSLSDRPNLLRGFLGQIDAPALERDEIAVLESNLDDSNPEWLGHLQERLLEAGALDVTLAPLLMKKNRPGQLLTVLAEPVRETELARLILRECSAIGVRTRRSSRFKLRRAATRVTTPAGEIDLKLVYEGSLLLRATPEFESCRAVARTSGLPLPEIYRQAERAAAELFPERNNPPEDAE